MLSKWDPFSDTARLQDEMNKWFTAPRGTALVPAVDISEDKEAIYLRAEAPGMNADQINVHVENNILTLKGERKFERDEKKETYHRVERAYGSFSRSFALPNEVDAEHIYANMKDGLLTVKIPKKGGAQPRRIEVKTT